MPIRLKWKSFPWISARTLPPPADGVRMNTPLPVPAVLNELFRTLTERVAGVALPMVSPVGPASAPPPFTMVTLLLDISRFWLAVTVMAVTLPDSLKILAWTRLPSLLARVMVPPCNYLLLKWYVL